MHGDHLISTLRRQASTWLDRARAWGGSPDYTPDELETLLHDQRLDLLSPWLERRVDRSPEDVLAWCERARAMDADHASITRVFARALYRLGRTDAYLIVENDIRHRGFRTVDAGGIGAGIKHFTFFRSAFPDMCDAYLRLYNTIDSLTRRYRRARYRPSAKRGLVISITVWGEQYVRLLTEYFLPSILSERNIPAVAARRSIVFDFYVTGEERASIEATASFSKLSQYGTVNFVSFPREILQSDEYRKFPGIRYHIYGGFHHVSIEHARARRADIICIAPDGVQSDGALLRFVELIDDGYKAVLFTSTRAQAEAAVPLLDRFRSADGTTLTIPAAELVHICTQHIHHDFLRHFLFQGNRRIPGFQSLMFFLNRFGFYVRCFHIHPIIMAYEAISRDITFNYSTVDENTLLRIFPDPAEFDSLKIIQDTREGLMVDLAYSFEEVPMPEIEFCKEKLLQQVDTLGPNHYWHFLHRVEYRCDHPIAHIGGYERMPDGVLKRVEIDVATALPVTDDEVEEFLKTHLPDQFDRLSGVN